MTGRNGLLVDYIDHSGSDLSVVNSARVSFDKEHTLFDEDKDTRLIKYLASHNHWTPFSHTSITLRVTAPIFVRTQCFKHKVGFVENEVSRRYVDSDPMFFRPTWRERHDNKKQGSAGEMQGYGSVKSSIAYNAAMDTAIRTYQTLLNNGVCPEQARMVLPQSMLTQWYWTGSLSAYARFYKQRTHETAQQETKELAEYVGSIVEPLYPVSWKELTI